MVRVDYVRKLYTTVTFHFSSSMWRFFWLSHNCVIYAFVTTTQLTLFFGTFRLRIKVTLYLRCFLVSHCDILCIMWQLHFSRLLKHIFLITLEMRCLLTTYGNTIQLFCVLSPHFWITFLWYVCIKYWNNVTATVSFCVSLWHFITTQLRYLFAQRSTFWWRQNYVELSKLLERVTCVWKLRYKWSVFSWSLSFWFVCIKYGNNVKITLHICSSKWRILENVIVTLLLALRQ